MIDRNHLNKLLSPSEWLLRFVFWGGALAVGALAVLFALGAQEGNRFFHWLVSISPAIPFVVMPLGLALSAWLTKRFFAGSQGSGIPQAIAALELDSHEEISKLLSLRIAAGKILLTILVLCCGASVGREGPTVQVGASLLYSLRRFPRFKYHDQLSGLIIAGGAAGIAAAFNTPLAGVTFAIEELSRSFEQRTNGLILTAVIFAGMAAHAILGNYAYFGRISSSLGSPEGWLAVVACGIAGGLAGGLFSRLMLAAAGGWRGAFGDWVKAHPVLFAALCGLVLAIIGALSGQQTYGTGYDEVRDILQNGGHESYGLYKFAATLVSYLSGTPGGIFAPSLAVGAGLGADLSQLFPYVAAHTVIVLGMVAYFAGVTQAPLTTFVIVMEMTDNHNIAIPLMATSMIAHGISRIVCREPLYHALAQRFLALNRPPQDSKP